MKTILVSLLLAFASSKAFPEEVDKPSKDENAANFNDELFFNVTFGISAFECMLGGEIQKRKRAQCFYFLALLPGISSSKAHI